MLAIIASVLIGIIAFTIWNSRNALVWLFGLQVVKLSELKFAAPNSEIPLFMRGVWWIDMKGKGEVVTVDLNMAHELGGTLIEKDLMLLFSILLMTCFACVLMRAR